MSISNDLSARPLAEQAVRALADQTAEIAAGRAADITAAKVVEGIFLHLGIDIHDREALKELRENLSFLARMNRGAVEIKRVAVKTCVGAVITGALALFGIGVHDWWLGHP